MLNPELESEPVQLTTYYTVFKAGSKLNHSTIQRHTVWDSGNVSTQAAEYNYQVTTES